MKRSGTNVPLALEAQAQGYGDNTIVWVPQGVPTGAPAGDVTYSVTVSNVVVSSQARVFTYSVTIIDPDLPALVVQRKGTNTWSVSWPAANTGFTLQQNAVLNNSNGWTTAPGSVQAGSNRCVATITNGPGQRFYRLRK